MPPRWRPATLLPERLQPETHNRQRKANPNSKPNSKPDPKSNAHPAPLNLPAIIDPPPVQAQTVHWKSIISMKILTSWLRSYLPPLPVDDARLAEDLTLRGIAVEGVFPGALPSASVFDMDITTNRVDAMNHYGIAREAAAIYNVALPPLDTTLPAPRPVPQPYPVRIEEPTLCGRFTAQVIRNVTISPSGGQVSAYFHDLGQKPISNAVDATNFTLLGMGHPTHAFDLDKIAGGIVVRRAHPGEQIKLLDGTTRTLVSEDLVVADDARALGLAGVMGGWDSMITAETTNVLVEAAWFDPATIRASSRRHLLHTDASHRFERGADFAAAPIANALVTKAILAACGGTLEGPLVDLVIPRLQAATANRPAIRLSIHTVQRLLGTTIAPEGITSDLVRRYLTALGCVLHPLGSDVYEVNLPSWRLDLTREIDLIEEVARVYGYNGFANTLPTPGVTLAHPLARKQHAVKARLFELGFSETISSTFASAGESAFFAPQTSAIALENPLSEEAAHLRPSLLPGMATMLAHNHNRDVLTARLFEAGAIFSGSAESVVEVESLALGLTGALPATPLHAAPDAPFFELKGALESLLALFATPTHTVTTASLPGHFEPGRAAVILLDQSPIAAFGQLTSAEAARRKLRQPIYLAELHLAQLFQLPLRQVLARELSRFQAVERDFSFTFADSTQWQRIAEAIHALAIPQLQKLEAIEIFRDPKKNPEHFSILLRVLFQSTDRTLVDTDLAAWSSAIIAALEALGGTLRS
jgi:phenylalanyl-tRNA synthetase beta chain